MAELGQMLRGAVDEVVISFVQPYRKTLRGLEKAAERHGFAWQDPSDDQKRSLVAELADLAASLRMRLTICSQSGYLAGEAAAARCVDARRLSDVAGRSIEARVKGNRTQCECFESRDIGGYDTCPMGCVYCYAVSNPDRATQRLRDHDPQAECLADGMGAQREDPGSQ
jgi:hypothetical protein